jgi:predicted nucleotidyltransferase
MQRDEIVRVLREHGDEFRREHAVRRLALFGSVARNEAGSGSDVDLLVEFARAPGFDGYMSLKFRIEDLLGCPVDLVMNKALRPFARPVVEREAIRVA